MRMNTADVARRLGYNVKYFQNNWRSIKGLPAPHQHELEGGGLSHPKWDASDIESFATATVKKAA